MLSLSSIMLGSKDPKTLASYYEKVLDKAPDMTQGSWSGWSVGGAYFSIMEHSEVSDKASEPGRIMFNFETKEVKKEFDRIKAIDGSQVIKEPYDPGMGGLIATIADPDGNYFQLMSPWK